MKPESVRALKAELAAEVVAQAGEGPAARSFFEASRPPTPENVALGIGLRADGEHVLAIRTEHPAIADALAARANGEADVRIIKVETRPTDPTYSARMRPLVSGAQIAMVGKNFVGTLGCFARDKAGVLYGVSNAHVVADSGRATIGHRIGQPSGWSAADYVGLLDRFAPYSPIVPNLADVGAFRCDRTDALPGFHAAAEGNMLKLRGTRRLTPDDLGRPFRKIGRSTGPQEGKLTAVEVDGLPVAMPDFVPRFDDQAEWSGGPGLDFSAAGDSGSLIIDRDGWAVGLLFAGGVSGGVDFTYGAYIQNALDLVGLTLALP